MHTTAVLKTRLSMVRLSIMPTCRMCTQNYPVNQFVKGNGPRYLVCARCAVEHDMMAPGETPLLYTDEVARARLSLFSRRYRPWVLIIIGWTLFLSMGRSIPPWSTLFLIVLIILTLTTPIRHFMTRTKFNFELSRLSP